MENKPSAFKVLFDKYHEIIMYCIFGMLTTIVSWLIYSLCERGLSSVGGINDDLEMVVAGVVSWIGAVSVAFVTNKLWVFESKSWDRKLVWTEAITFYGGRGLTGLIEVAAVPALVKCGFDLVIFGVDGLPAKIVVSVLIMILNYILSKFISFKGKKTKDA